MLSRLASEAPVPGSSRLQSNQVFRPQIEVLQLHPTPRGMSNNYHYEELGENQIRLLWLQPATTLDAPLECKIGICDRKPGLEYEALSYVWGEDDDLYPLKVKSTPENVLEGNRHFFIRRNLAAALKSELLPLTSTFSRRFGTRKKRD